MTRRLVSIVLPAAILFLSAAAASACPSCYGAADSPMVDGMNTAVMSMVGIIAMVLTGIASFFMAMKRRMERLSDASSEFERPQL